MTRRHLNLDSPCPKPPIVMKTIAIDKLCSGLILIMSSSLPVLHGQVAPPARAVDDNAPGINASTRANADALIIAEDKIVVLSPFVVLPDEDNGYQASSTLSGSRLRTRLSEIAAPISVITSAFMQDTGSTNLKDLLVYTTNTEIGGFGGNFSGVDKASGFSGGIPLLSDGNGPTRVRGLSGADLTRGFFPTGIPIDGYNVQNIEISRGANAMLFGLGSPAGIINMNLKVPTLRKDTYTGAIAVGRFGSLRKMVDLDKALIKDHLGVRIMLLDDTRKFEQEFTFARDKRFFGSAGWRSDKFGHTEINIDYERGRVESNRPRTTPPGDGLTAWYDPQGLNKLTKNPENGDADIANPRIGAILDTAGRWFDRQGAVWIDPTSSDQGGPGLPQTMPGTGGGVPFKVWSAVATYSTAGNNPLHFLNTRLGLPAGQALKGLWKDQEILDSSVFDFYNYNIEGPNKRVWDDFNALNINLRQTFFKNAVGFELSRNEEEFDQTRFNQVLFNEYRIMIDMITNLFDGTPNPNLGRPFFVGEATGGTSKAEREANRATAFAEFDFNKIMGKGGLLARIIGRHVFTGNYSELKSRSFSTAFSGYGYTLEQNVFANNANARGYPFWAGMHYLGDKINQLSSPSGANIRGIQADQIPLKTAQALMYDARISKWIKTPVTTLDWKNDRDSLYTAANKGRDHAKSLSFTWQSYFLNGAIAGMLGWREDKYQTFTSPAVPRTSVTTVPIPFDPNWQINQKPAIDVEGEAISWGVVVHTPTFIKKYFPLGLDVNLAYNSAGNFRPTSTTADAYGKPFASPAGKSKDISMIVSMMDQKLIARITSYETTQSNDRATFMVPFWIGDGISRGMNGLRTTPVHEKIINKWFGFKPGDPNYLPERASLSDPALMNLTIPPITAAEQAFRNAWFAQRTREEWLRPVDPKLAEAWKFTQNSAGNWTVTAPPNVGNVANTVSKGLEFELTYNPTKQWRIFVTVAQQKARKSGLGADFTEFVNANKGIWLDGNGVIATKTIEMDGFEDITHFNGFGANMVGLTTVNNLYIPYLNALAADGAPVSELREWRANVVTNYTFAQERLRGFNIGGAARWQGSSAIGFPAIFSADSKQYLSDVKNPFYADDQVEFDLTIGYTRKLAKGKVDWSVQLNVRNIFGSDSLIPIQAQPDGTIASATIPQPNKWTITNTFTF